MRLTLICLVVSHAFLILVSSVQSAVLTWDGNIISPGLQDGGGTWNTTATNHWFDSATSSYQIWSSSPFDDAVFGVNVNAAGIVTIGSGVTVGNITFNASGGTYTLGGTTDALTLGSASVITTNVDAIISVPLAGTHGMTKTGSGALTFSGTAASTLTGTTMVGMGTLILGKTAGVNAVAGDILVNGGELDWAANNQMSSTSSLTLSSGTVNFSGKNETMLNYTQTGGTSDILAVSNSNIGVVTFTGTVTVSGGQTFTVNSSGVFNANKVDFTGYPGVALQIGGASTENITTLTIRAGGLVLSGQTLLLNQADTASLGARLVLQGDVTASGQNFIVSNNNNGASGQLGLVDMGTGTRTWNVTSSTTDIELALIGSANLLKTGVGTMALNTLNTYTGKTTVNQGFLTLGASGSIDSSPWIQIDGGAVFNTTAHTGAGGYLYTPAGGSGGISGSGTVNGSLTITQGVVIKPGPTSNPADINTAGDGIGTLNTGSLTFAATSLSTVVQLKILTSAAADQINIIGALTLNGNSNMAVSFDHGYTPVPGDAWTLLEWSGALTLGGFSTGTDFRTGNNADLNEGNLDLPDLSSLGYTWDISTMVSGGALTVTVAPEPGRLLLSLGGLGFVFFRRRRS